ncbi:MAG: HAMP domain-containing sensor histidine kinase [Campylobacterota bacterium]|nr:HAMP domain-containing sensor histidine kinase [Campylobacterota bacterium]
MDAVAHQWIQPLSTIKVSAANLEIKQNFNMIDNKDIDNIINTTKTQIDYLLDTLNSFRNFFRPNQKREYFNISNQIESVLKLMKDDLIANKIDIKIIGDNSLSYNIIQTDFKHIFINLINNSKDAFNINNIQNRKITITLLEDDSYIKIVVSDNAGGIPLNIIDDIFKVNVTTKSEDKGTGIGLYMSKQIIEKIDATIDVKNIENGALFTIALPK